MNSQCPVRCFSQLNPLIAIHDYNRFSLVLLAGQVTVWELKVCLYITISKSYVWNYADMSNVYPLKAVERGLEETSGRKFKLCNFAF